MAYPPHHLEWIHPFQAFRHIESSSAAGRTEKGLPTPITENDVRCFDPIVINISENSTKAERCTDVMLKL